MSAFRFGRKELLGSRNVTVLELAGVDFCYEVRPGAGREAMLEQRVALGAAKRTGQTPSAQRRLSVHAIEAKL
jgi:hypothetical protein